MIQICQNELTNHTPVTVRKLTVSVLVCQLRLVAKFWSDDVLKDAHVWRFSTSLKWYPPHAGGYFCWRYNGDIRDSPIYSYIIEGMIANEYRFHGHNSLRYVYSNGKAVRSQLFTVKYVYNSHRTHPRFSVVVSKKVIKSAVGRNRVRRRLYEYLRVNTDKLSGVYDIVIICSSGELRALPFAHIAEQLDLLFTKAHLYKTPENWYT